MKRIIRIVALLMAALMVVTSCQAPDSGSQLTDGIVDVSFAGPSARTITTDDGLVQTVATSNLWFQYKAVWEGSGEAPDTAKNAWTNLGGPGLTDTIKLHRGRWNLSLRAYVNQFDVGEDDKFILSGTKGGVEIGTNNMVTQTVSISLGYVRQEGNGTLHISATYPVIYHEAANSGDSPVEAVRKVKVTANVAGTDYTGEITAFDSNNVGTLDLTVPAGAAHVTVQYYMDDSSLFEDDKTSKDVLIMATMTTNLSVSVNRDITVVTFKAEQPTGTVEDNALPKAASLFDIYPDKINDNEIVIGYAEETKALGTQTPITYPYTILTSASPDSQGRYNASDLRLIPITVTTKTDLNASGATSAWWGKTAALGSDTTENTTLASVRFVDGVTSIKPFAFFYCGALNDIAIPESVTSIGQFAFGMCTGLTSIAIPNNITEAFAPFYFCLNLNQAVISEGTTCIFPGMFIGCVNLTDITIPDSIIYIGEEAFSGCKSLANIAIPDNVTYIGGSAFNGCAALIDITIPDTVTEIGNETFCGCSRLANIIIPNSVTSIGEQAFRECTSLTSVAIPDSVTSVGDLAFMNCTGLTDISISNNITSIGSSTFDGCTSLTNVTIPDGVTSIGENAFNDCLSLTSVAIPNSVTSIEGWAFSGCTSLTSVTIPDNVTAIGKWAFYGCTSLTSVTIPASVTNILYSAFGGCTNLTEINVAESNPSYASVDGVLFNKGMTKILAYPLGKNLDNYNVPDGIETIGKNAFYYCATLTNITIPDTVTSIEEEAFYKCTGLTSITIPNSVTSIEYSAFKGCAALTDIYVDQAESTLLKYSGVPEGCTIHWNSTGSESV